ncbi:hypothetical protein MMC19_006218 [Ptychographa xylographoides]|nr:hypothetical protein [Ptychographa xylographoides]
MTKSSPVKVEAAVQAWTAVTARVSEDEYESERQQSDNDDSADRQLRQETRRAVAVLIPKLPAPDTASESSSDIQTQLLAEQSASIINNALEDYPRQDMAARLGTPISFNKKHRLEPETVEHPNKRQQNDAHAVSSGAMNMAEVSDMRQSHGRPKFLTRRPAQQERAFTTSYSGEENFDFPEASPVRHAPCSTTSPYVIATIENTTDATKKLRSYHLEDELASEAQKVTKTRKKPGRPKKATSELPSRNRAILPVAGASKPQSYGTRNLRSKSNLQAGPIPTSNKRMTRSRMTQDREATTTSGSAQHLSRRQKTDITQLDDSEASPDSMAKAAKSVATIPAKASKMLKGGNVEATKEVEESDSERSDGHSSMLTANREETSSQLSKNKSQKAPVEGDDESDGDFSDSSRLSESQDAVDLDVQSPRGLRQRPGVVELFGEEDDWATILKAARSVRSSRSGKNPSRIKVPIQTSIFKKFLRRVRDTIHCYHRVGVSDTVGNNPEHVVIQLHDHLQLLRSEVGSIVKSEDGTKNPELITDIYAHAIPSLVFLVEHALKVRSPRYSATDDTQSLQEVIRVQQLVIALGTAVRAWKATKPNIEIPIIRPTSRVILPRMRALCRAFRTELKIRRVNKRAVEEEAAKLRMYQKREKIWQRDQERILRERERKQRLATKDVLRLSQKAAFPSSHSHMQQPAAKDRWTEEQDLELLRLLMKYCHIPVDRRYISLLNTHLLQNKLPEHIRARSLELKPSMERSYLQDQLSIPEWVSSLQ